MGVDHFTFYNTNGMAPNVVDVVEQARHHGLSIDVLPWNLQRSNIAFNQYLAINACIYWQSPYYEHSVVVDTDEYIVARGPDILSLPKMLAGLDEKHPNSACYLFRHFLFARPKNVTQQDDSAFDLFAFTARQSELFHPQTRSKVICKSERVVTSTVHTSAEILDAYEEIIVDPDFAGLFHFRPEGLGYVTSFSADTEMLKMRSLFMGHPLVKEFVKKKEMNY